MGIELREVTCTDGADTYQMLQQLPAEENGFGNAGFGMPYEAYPQWLASNVESPAKTEVEKGWMVPQTTYWLYEDGVPVGIGRIRRFLTEKLLEEGGNLSYAVVPPARGRGLGRHLLAELLEECRRMGMDRVLLTGQKGNLPSQRVILANGGALEKESEKYWYYWIKL